MSERDENRTMRRRDKVFGWMTMTTEQQQSVWSVSRGGDYSTVVLERGTTTSVGEGWWHRCSRRMMVNEAEKGNSSNETLSFSFAKAMDTLSRCSVHRLHTTPSINSFSHCPIVI